MRRWVQGHCPEAICRRAFSSSRAFSGRVSINDLIRGSTQVDDAEVCGWVRHVRKQKKIAFAHVSDGHSPTALQAVFPQPELAKDLSHGAAVALTGRFAQSPGSGQGYELLVRDCKILGANDPASNPIQPKYQTQEFLRTVPHLRWRMASSAVLLRLRSKLIASITNFFDGQDFVQTHTPIITSSDCEGAGEVFTVSAGDSERARSATGQPQSEMFFRTPKYLTVSAQLHLEALAQAVDKVWTLSPTFRAERSDTQRHLAEFYMLEAEICFTRSLDQVMDLVEDMLRHATSDLMQTSVYNDLAHVEDRASGDTDSEGLRATSGKALEQRWQGLASTKWPRVSYDDAVKLLRSEVEAGRANFETAVTYDDGFATEHERFLASSLGQGKPVFIYRYPRNQKPFYMPPSPGQDNTAECFDLLVPEVCELAGGSLREHRLEALQQTMCEKGVSGANMDWYMDLRKYGSVPHGGFGLGFDRLLCYLSGVGNVRDVVPFPRWCGRGDC